MRVTASAFSSVQPKAPQCTIPGLAQLDAVLPTPDRPPETPPLSLPLTQRRPMLPVCQQMAMTPLSPREPCWVQRRAQGWAAGLGARSTYCEDQQQQPLRQNRRRGSPARQGRRGSPGGTCAPSRLHGGGRARAVTLPAPMSPASRPLGLTSQSPGFAAHPHWSPLPSLVQVRRQPTHLRTERLPRAGQAPSGPCGGWWAPAGSCGGPDTSAPANAAGPPEPARRAASAGTSFPRTCP